MKYFVFPVILIIVAYLSGFTKRPENFQWMDRNDTQQLRDFRY